MFNSLNVIVDYINKFNINVKTIPLNQLDSFVIPSLSLNKHLELRSKLFRIESIRELIKDNDFTTYNHLMYKNVSETLGGF